MATSPLAPGTSRHQILHRLPWVLALIEHAIHFAADRHGDAHRGRLLVDAARRVNALGDHRHATEDVRRFLALRQTQADHAIAAMLADTRRDQIADAGEPREGA